MAKRPAFQFYPSDHRGETGLQLSSLAARGLWSEMLCVMHEGAPYGHLTTAAGHPIEPAQLARMVGESGTTVRRLLGELEDAGVFSRTELGVIYSRRMVRDEHIRTVRAEAGKRGGNPNLTGKHPVKHGGSDLLKQTDKQMPTPSSSSSSSEEDPPVVPQEGDAKTKRVRRGTTLPSDWEPNDQHRERAAETGIDLDAEAEAFRDHHTAKASVFKDWDAAFRTWLRNARRFAGGGHGGGSTANGGGGSGPVLDLDTAPWLQGFAGGGR